MISINSIINDVDMIVNNLYLGNYKSPDFCNGKVSLIINCTKDLPLTETETIRIPINDDPSECDNLLQFIEDNNILEKIHSTIVGGKSVLVHCKAGAQRSCAVVALYIIKYYKTQPSEAIEYIKKHRAIAFFGHVNFMKALQGDIQGDILSPSTPSGLA
jgi:protein tyrosine/serine phosphatase